MVYLIWLTRLNLMPKECAIPPLLLKSHLELTYLTTILRDPCEKTKKWGIECFLNVRIKVGALPKMWESWNINHSCLFHTLVKTWGGPHGTHIKCETLEKMASTDFVFKTMMLNSHLYLWCRPWWGRTTHPARPRLACGINIIVCLFVLQRSMLWMRKWSPSKY